MSNRLAGRTVVVTGAGQGIGRAMARNIAANGGTVILADINDDAGKNVVTEIEDAGGTAQFVHLDAGDPAGITAFAATVTAEFGRVDGLVNNAAVFSTITMKPFWEISAQEWDRLMAVNLRGPWLLISALLPALRASGSASVVNIGSDAVWLGRTGYLHYIASKAGVAGMSFAMAHELGGDNIRVNTVAPGVVHTEIERATVTQAQKDALVEAQCLHRLAGPDDQVGTVTFLLSDESAFVTGQTLAVNGGLLHH